MPLKLAQTPSSSDIPYQYHSLTSPGDCLSVISAQCNSSWQVHIILRTPQSQSVASTRQTAYLKRKSRLKDDICPTGPDLQRRRRLTYGPHLQMSWHSGRHFDPRISTPGRI